MQTPCGSPRCMNFKNVIPTLGGNDGFENNRQNVNSPGQSRLQKSKNHVDMFRKRVLFWPSRRRGVEKTVFGTPTEHGNQTKI